MADAVAWVPVHPKNGPLWNMTTANPTAENMTSYPLMPLYADALTHLPLATTEMVECVAAVQAFGAFVCKLERLASDGADLSERFDLADERSAIHGRLLRASQAIDAASVREVEAERDKWESIADKAVRSNGDLLQQNAALEAQLTAATERAEKAEATAAGVVNVLGFFASCIKCGEPWTPECEAMMRKAFPDRAARSEGQSNG